MYAQHVKHLFMNLNTNTILVLVGQVLTEQLQKMWNLMLIMKLDMLEQN